VVAPVITLAGLVVFAALLIFRHGPARQV